ncbi:RNA-directed DNA polymerase, eukaryota, reverse transcriptase zinc-binding domain protein [Tanacetum coccineum]|uniref:RNA-directed DNA polymerase, eukaryota, reverse transcriptase zinc-binding domain protein n=1 Tax=Tanacetum coccineum TaxID=301880 RepID=A0ABQ5BSU9_9ASTR
MVLFRKIAAMRGRGFRKFYHLANDECCSRWEDSLGWKLVDSQSGTLFDKSEEEIDQMAIEGDENREILPRYLKRAPANPDSSGCHGQYGVWIDDTGQGEDVFLNGIFGSRVLQWCRKKRKHALIFKVDFEKAYDSVRWDFLDDVLDKFGFGVKWRNWIQSCLRSSRGSILINGSPTKEFQFFRGRRYCIGKTCLEFESGFEGPCLGYLDGSANLSMEEDSHFSMSVLGSMQSSICPIFKVPSSFLIHLKFIRSRFLIGYEHKSNKALGLSGTNFNFKEKDKVGASAVGPVGLQCPGGEGDTKPRTKFHDFIKLKLGNVEFKVKAQLSYTFRRNARSGIEQTQFDSMAEIMKTISLVPRVDRYIWSLENDGSFSVASIRKTLDGQTVPGRRVVDSKVVKSNPCLSRLIFWLGKLNLMLFLLVMRKISSWWNVEYMEVFISYEEWRFLLVVYPDFDQTFNVIIEGV